jgi:porin
MKKLLATGFPLIIIIVIPVSSFAWEIEERMLFEGTLSCVYQLADVATGGKHDKDRGVMVFDVGVNFHPVKTDEFQLVLGFGQGNGLNATSLFSVSPYADDVEDDLRNINGRHMDHVLEAWYRHTFSLHESISLGVTGGVIDATSYIDDNRFANDEISQFMNDVFVNATIANLHSHDFGVVLEGDMQGISVKALVINGSSEQEKNYNYYAAQLGLVIDSGLGEGNFRMYGFTTRHRLEDGHKNSRRRLAGMGLSIDQETGSLTGVFCRIAWQGNMSGIDHKAFYSAGFNVNGNLWGKGNHEVGVGCAYLAGADHSDIRKTHVFESYFKIQINMFSDISLDFQYINDSLRWEKDSKALIYGMRFNVGF